MYFPTLSIVSGLYNTDLKLWKKTLTAIRQQKYPHTKIEHIVMDAGSTNGADRLARDFGCTVIKRPDLIGRGSVRMSLGISKAKGELVLILEPDNIMIGSNWLKEMIRPFQEQPEVFAAFSMYNASDKTMPALTRYCALIGANDPTLFYLHKSEKMPRYKERYDLGKILEDKPTYSVVRFTKENLPTLGDNGHMVRRKIIQKVNGDPDTFIHVNAFADLLGMGFDTYAVVKNSVVHYTGSSIIDLISRRVLYKEHYFDTLRRKRSYYIFDSRVHEDKKNLILYVTFSLTFIQPLLISIRGYLGFPDTAWFLHPVVSFCMVVAYGLSEFKRIISSE